MSPEDHRTQAQAIAQRLQIRATLFAYRALTDEYAWKHESYRGNIRAEVSMIFAKPSSDVYAQHIGGYRKNQVTGEHGWMRID